ncbi:hypothetical protein [Pseudomonas fluorescens]|uniref:Uncharacterized protein n=1 Tax=Pseudomonas fluorescens TaxID=294 RepID=A0A5E7EAR6_PSEFL|nr:hypothetical protein [Pseudomonas fluorescens]VVO23749.1 hypothetical protein PS723_04423 [Pseudomonas fluorescens]
MSTDSSFEDETQGSVPSKPEPGTDEPTMDPDAPGESDPLARPDVVTREHPQERKDRSAGDGIPDDEDMPLPND